MTRDSTGVQIVEHRGRQQPFTVWIPTLRDEYAPNGHLRVWKFCETRKEAEAYVLAKTARRENQAMIQGRDR